MKYLLYPFENKIQPIVDYVNQYSSDIEITGISAPETWKSKLKDSKQVSFDFEESLKEAEGLLIIDTEKNRFMHSDIVNKIIEAIESKKDILCFTFLRAEDIERIESLAQENRISFQYFGESEDLDEDYEVYHQQDAIIIAIGDLFEGLDSFPVLLNLSKGLRDLGYRVTTVSDNKNAALLDFVSFPSGLFDSELPYDAMIKGLNDFYNNLELMYQPDIILTQIPYGMMSYSEVCPGDFGVQAYMVSQSLSVDYFVLATPVEEFDGQGFEKLSTLFRYRFGFDISAVGVFNKIIDSAASEEEEKLLYESIENSELDEYIDYLNETKSSDEHIIFFNIQDSLSYPSVIDNIIETLGEEDD